MPTQTTYPNSHSSAYVADYLYIPHKVHPFIKRPSIVEDAEDHMATALNMIITALAHLHRTGHKYAQRCEAFWPFCAGSWDREEYEEQLAFAMEELAGIWVADEDAAESVEVYEALLNDTVVDLGIGEEVRAEEDVRVAEELLDDAVAMLREHVDERDAEDLEMAREDFWWCGKW